MPPDTPTSVEDSARGSAAWKAQTKAIERVIDVAQTLEQPRTANWIAEQAAVAEQTARDHLDLLTDLGVLTATTAHSVTRYQPDAAYARFQTVSRCVEQHTKTDLLDTVEELREQTAAIETEYGVETPDELRALATDEETPIEDITDYRRAAAEWDSLRHRLSIYQEALERYDEFDREAVTA